MVLSHSLGHPLRYKQCLAISLSSEFGIAATPVGMGGAVIRLALLRRAGISLAHGTSMLATDVALDICYFLLLLPLAIYSLMRNQKILALFQKWDNRSWIPILIGALFFILFIYLVIRYHLIWRGIKKIAAWPKLDPYRLPARFRLLKWKLIVEIRHFKEGLHILFRMRRSAVLINFCLASMQWTCRYSILPLILYAFSLINDPIPLFLLQGLLFSASLLFVLPGGGGGVEMTTAFILGLLIPKALVGVVLLLWRFFTYHLYLAGGGVAFTLVCAYLNTLFPPANGMEEDEGITFQNDGNVKVEI